MGSQEIDDAVLSDRTAWNDTGKLAAHTGDITVAVSNISMSYSVRATSQRYGIAGALTATFRREKVQALTKINFVARSGEFVGVVGSNGSGKSTLLRLIAGVEQPDSGRVLASKQPMLLGVSAALHPHLSGLANIRLGCLAMGMTPREAESRVDEIVELSALGEAIRRPMGTYSSGMGARLRFAIAVAARPSIMLIDEALSTGDATFYERSKEATRSMLDDAGTVFLVSHAAKTIQEMCTRAIWLHKGEFIRDGSAEDVAEAYRWWAWNEAKGKTDIANKLLADAREQGQEQLVEITEDLSKLRKMAPRHASPFIAPPRHSNLHA